MHPCHVPTTLAWSCALHHLLFLLLCVAGTCPELALAQSTSQVPQDGLGASCSWPQNPPVPSARCWQHEVPPAAQVSHAAAPQVPGAPAVP